MYTDMEKPFDRINRNVLVDKLKSFGFDEPLISWFHLFILGRTEIIKHGNYFSLNKSMLLQK